MVESERVKSRPMYLPNATTDSSVTRESMERAAPDGDWTLVPNHRYCPTIQPLSYCVRGRSRMLNRVMRPCIELHMY